MAGGRASVAAPQPTARAAGCEYCRRCMGATIREWQPGPDGYRLRKLGHRFRRNSQWFQPVTIQQTGHCYITGNTVHGSSSTQSGLWAIIVADANHYQRSTLISGAYTPSVGDETFLRTTIRPSTDRWMPTSSLACSRTTSTPSAPRCSQPTPARSANCSGPTTSLRNVLLLTGRPIPAGRAPQSGRQSPVAISDSIGLGPRSSKDGSVVLGLDLSELHQRTGGHRIPGHGPRQLGGDRGGISGAVVQRRLSVDHGVRARCEPVDSVDSLLGPRPSVPVQLALAATERNGPRGVSIEVLALQAVSSFRASGLIPVPLSGGAVNPACPLRRIVLANSTQPPSRRAW